jgi:urease accessory protein
MVMAQAAEKIYGSSRYDSFINVDLKAKSMAWAEYLPQETILFDGARLNRTTRIEAATGAQILAGEIIVFGRQGRGESFTSGFLRDAWEVKRDQKLIWADTLLLKNNVSKVINHPTCFDGASVVATVILICDDVESYVGEAQGILRDNCTTIRAGASLINGVLVARFIGKDALQLRKSFSLLWQSLRHSVAALPKSMPRLWQI